MLRRDEHAAFENDSNFNSADCTLIDQLCVQIGFPRSEGDPKQGHCPQYIGVHQAHRDCSQQTEGRRQEH